MCVTSPVSIESGMLVTCCMQYAMSMSRVLWCGDVVSLGGKYVFETVMCLVLPMCILTSCSSMLCVLLVLCMFMFVKVVLDECDEIPSLFVYLSVCMVV